VQDIAAEAGVNQALIHYYFRSKDALAERVFLDAARQLGAAVLAGPMPEQTLETMIERFITGYIDAIRQAPFIPAYVLAEAHQVPVRVDQLMQAAIGTVPSAVAGSLLGRLETQIAARVAAGTMRPITPRQLLVHVMALCVFPFLARPVLGRALGLDDDGFQRFLDERRAELPGFVLNALQP
jgi:AcrR family transcriptional regulator